MVRGGWPQRPLTERKRKEEMIFYLLFGYIGIGVLVASWVLWRSLRRRRQLWEEGDWPFVLMLSVFMVVIWPLWLFTAEEVRQ